MTLKKGSRGAEVKELQTLLHLFPDGIFGTITEEAVIDFQKKNGLTADGVVGDNTWKVLKGLKVSKRTINEIIIHCTATKEGKNYTVAEIKNMHLARGFSDVGYHYIIDINGKLDFGRPVDIVGAHCSGHNAHSIGICYIGGLDANNKPKDTRTAKQKDALNELIRSLKGLYPTAKILGHRDTSPDLNGNGLVEKFEWIKVCPCFNVKDEYK